jgi:hypothetical protein
VLYGELPASDLVRSAQRAGGGGGAGRGGALPQAAGLGAALELQMAAGGSQGGGDGGSS